ncbi:MAG: hypothetical protein GIKADHBN_01984 [Phycisphaerales bacterium]|nr:hypothetical protein [Phycisphaerales bacterium]
MYHHGPMRIPLPASKLSLIVLAGLCSQAAAQTVDRMWREHCASCHSNDGSGGPKAASLLDDEWKTGGSLREMFAAVKTGHKDLGDAAQFDKTLTDPRIWALVNYLHELRFQNYRANDGGPKRESGDVFASQHHRYKIERVVEDGLATPWSVEFVPDLGDRTAEPLSGAMLITEKPGKMRVGTLGTDGARATLSAPIEGIPEVSNDGQGGLMDIALHPNFKENRLVYLSYAEALGGDPKKVMTKVIRGRINPSKGGGWTWTTDRVIFEARPEHYLSPGVHYGCRIAFDPKDSSILFFAIGERGRMQMAQDLTRPNGKVHRVKDDGSIPFDNPFASNTGPVYKSIWSYGHRNPQGLVFDLYGHLWDTEHGPRGGDELNLIIKGRNYGWPVVTYGINYDGNPFGLPWPDMVGKKEASLDPAVYESDPDSIAMPTYVWLPSIAACGLTVSNGGILPEWKGDLFAGGLAGLTVQRMRVKDGKVVEREEIVHNEGRVRDVVCGPDGAIYIAVNQPDAIIRVVPADK